MSSRLPRSVVDTDTYYTYVYTVHRCDRLLSLAVLIHHAVAADAIVIVLHRHAYIKMEPSVHVCTGRLEPKRLVLD